jgi:hypothetical protein
MVVGQHHHVSPQYLCQFANEAAWKEDQRRLSNGELSRRKLTLRWRMRLAATGLGIGSRRTS